MSESWYFQGNVVTDDMITEDIVGFVYMITNTRTGKKYIGQKRTWKTITRPPLKGKKRKRKTLVQSDWQNYYSSGEEINRQLALYGPKIFKREILHFAYSKGMLNYMELREQIVRDVLLSDDYDNGIIQTRINKKHLTDVRPHIHKCIT